MNQGCVVGIDIGGTKVAAGIVDLQGNVLSGSRVPMVARGSAADGLAAVASAIMSRSHKSLPLMMFATSVCVLPAPSIRVPGS